MFECPLMLTQCFTLASEAADTQAATGEVVPLFSLQNLLALITLTLLEVALGIDNIVVIAILCGKLPEHQRARATKIGLMLAMITRVLLLLSITWVMRLKHPWFNILDHDVTGKDVILILGGAFLLYKTTREIYTASEGKHVSLNAAEKLPPPTNIDGSPSAENKELAKRGAALFSSIILQIVLIDIIFSLDSVITAVGMASQSLAVMVAAVIICVLIMMSFAPTISYYIEKHPSLKMLALSFLVLIGTLLVAEGFGKHIPKGYIYAAMGFSLFVEVLNIRMRSKTRHVPAETEDGGS
jgi:predicted tellurium resistance membrane protein TerC